MDFFEHQDQARRNTKWLVVLFILAVVVIIASICGVTAVVLATIADASPTQSFSEVGYYPQETPRYYADWRIYAGIAIGTIAIVTLGSLYKIGSLAEGGHAVAEMLGGRLVHHASRNPAERRLLNVVEEMAIASGIPVPPVYILEGERAINAFAAGFAPTSAVVAVTRGALETLSRDELQGVMGHEFSHILNGDMRLNIRLIGIVHGILVIALVGYYVFRTTANVRPGRSSRDRGSGGLILAMILIGVSLIAIGYIGVFFGRMIKAAVSRQREYLADAASVQFTRNPGGLSGALQKIGGLVGGSRIEAPQAEQISHMFFANGLASRMFSTHPPLADRIRRIDPQFDGKFPKVSGAALGPAADRAAAGFAPAPKTSRLTPSSATDLQRLRQKRATALEPATVVGQVGTLDEEHLVYTHALLAATPQALRDAAAETYGARAVIYALLLDDEQEVRAQQLDRLRKHAEELSYRQTLVAADAVDDLDEAVRVPLADLCLPTLRELTAEQYDRFRSNVTALVEADQRVAMWEYVLWTMLTRPLDLHFKRRPPARRRFRSLGAVSEPLHIALSTLARVGQNSEPEVESAVAAGLAAVGRSGKPLPRERCSLSAFDGAVQTLAQSSDVVKRRLVEAFVACVCADRTATTREFELLRALTATLDCPMPPLPASLPTPSRPSA